MQIMATIAPKLPSEQSRRVPIYKLIRHKDVLKQLLSFSAHVDRINFETRVGWGGKIYVADNRHELDDYRPDIRGVDLLDVYYLKIADTVVLTPEQHADYLVVSKM